MNNSLTSGGTPSPQSPGNPARKPQQISLRSQHPNFQTNIQPQLGKESNDILVENLPYGRIYHLIITDEDGKPQYDLAAMAEPMGAVCLALRLSESQTFEVALLRHWRPVPSSNPRTEALLAPNPAAHGSYILETPRGFPKDGESCVEAAMREVEEELQLRSIKAIQLGTINANTAFMMTDIPLCVVLVSSTAEVKSVVQVEEVIDAVIWVSVSEVAATISSGRVRCALTLAALAHLMASRDRIEQFLHS